MEVGSSVGGLSAPREVRGLDSRRSDSVGEYRIFGSSEMSGVSRQFLTAQACMSP